MNSTVADHLTRMAAGEVDRGLMEVGGLASGNAIGVPYMIARGTGGGPCLWVNATVHGDESQASIVATEFFRAVSAHPLRGDVIVTPVANPLAFDQRRKHSPFDGTDLDQSFPGRSDFLGTQRLAHRLFSELSPLADTVVNIHTMGPFLDACNYAVYKLHPAAGDERELLSLIALFDLRVACRMDVSGPGELPGRVEGALDYQMLELGKRAFMLEAGAGGRYDRPAVEKAVRGLLRFAAETGTAAKTDAPGDRPASICRATRRTHVTSAEGGFFRALAEPGDVVPAGRPLGEIRNVYGDKVEAVSLPTPALVIGIRRDPIVHSGDRVGFVATEWADIDLTAPSGETS
ncbi:MULTISPECIES: M14 family metallopeptidase [unclassified Actinomadura]|uniref:M14 family metallopeptidase n=1 Tax=unclassified Actinomadura TaxID=2626254 RepID=UPI0011EC123A|nr:M14 family metallopeptidase [Actinomadura sp. K4S16]